MFKTECTVYSDSVVSEFDYMERKKDIATRAKQKVSGKVDERMHMLLHSCLRYEMSFKKRSAYQVTLSTIVEECGKHASKANDARKRCMMIHMDELKTLSRAPSAVPRPSSALDFKKSGVLSLPTNHTAAKPKPIISAVSSVAPVLPPVPPPKPLKHRYPVKRKANVLATPVSTTVSTDLKVSLTTSESSDRNDYLVKSESNVSQSNVSLSKVTPPVSSWSSFSSVGMTCLFKRQKTSIPLESSLFGSEVTLATSAGPVETSTVSKETIPEYPSWSPPFGDHPLVAEDLRCIQSVTPISVS